MEDAIWNHALFSKNRNPLLTSEVVQWFSAEVNKQAKRFISDEHFTVDGTLTLAWAPQTSFAPGTQGSSGPRNGFGPGRRADVIADDSSIALGDPGQRLSIVHLDHLDDVDALQKRLCRFSALGLLGRHRAVAGCLVGP